MHPTLTEGGPLWLMALLALAAWGILALVLWLEGRPTTRYRRRDQETMRVNTLAKTRKGTRM
jgi:hypothetical protein